MKVKPRMPDFPVISKTCAALQMDQAIGIEKASLSTVVTLNSCAIDVYQNLLDTAAKSFAFCMELQMSLLNLMASHVADTVESISGMQAQLTAEVLERSMDIAIGAQITAPSTMVESSSENQAQPTEEVPEHSDEIASVARAA